MPESCRLFSCRLYRLKAESLPACRWRREQRPCKDLIHRNDWFAELAQRIKARIYHERTKAVIIEDRCSTCGRTWRGSASAMSKQAGTQRRHKIACARRTPAERRTILRREIKRYAQRTNHDIVVTLDADHPGVGPDVRMGRNSKKSPEKNLRSYRKKSS
jgi:hypothetical protein